MIYIIIKVQLEKWHSDMYILNGGAAKYMNKIC